MKAEIITRATDDTGRTFIGWAPVEARIRLSEAGGAQGMVTVTLKNDGAPDGGVVAFDNARSDDGQAELRIDVPADGSEAMFWLQGKFRHPSIDYGDAAVAAHGPDGAVIGRRELMVRVRKNAQKLLPAERDRFLVALGKLNDQGRGPFQAFRDMHVADAYDEAHGHPGFPAWHRAYLLDLERELQAIDATVTLPYWRFDEAAPALFDAAFMGMPPRSPAEGNVIDFPHGHPLEFWKTDGQDAIQRRPRFNINGAPPKGTHANPGVISQYDTMALGDQYEQFRNYEVAPHGAAHVSFDGAIRSPPTAPKDPLFFLLHANVDRLWALWQWVNRRFDGSEIASYSTAGDPEPREPGNIGHNLSDTMWPWNGTKVPPRPSFDPPRRAFPLSPLVSRPGLHPKIEDMIDYQGVLADGSLGFDYDDVPFELHASGAIV